MRRVGRGAFGARLRELDAELDAGVRGLGAGSSLRWIGGDGIKLVPCGPMKEPPVNASWGTNVRSRTEEDVREDDNNLPRW